jgi:F1F0 ATPase subunit 2
MTETLRLLLAWAEGGLLGAIFFGGLWWTVRKGVSSKRPALWFSGSMLLRTSIVLTGFYFVFDDHWQRLLLCILGFFMANLVARLFARSAEMREIRAPREVGHAP